MGFEDGEELVDTIMHAFNSPDGIREVKRIRHAYFELLSIPLMGFLPEGDLTMADKELSIPLIGFYCSPRITKVVVRIFQFP